VSSGVAGGAFAVETTVALRGHASDAISAADFPPAFLAVAAISALSTFLFAQLPRDAGAELANRLPEPAGNPAQAPDQRIS
jgi:hypothetical protein